MPSFRESDLLFTFPDDWVVRPFDDTVAYQSLSGHGLKGVDFIALSPDGKLWLMEVKNYYPRKAKEKTYLANRKSPAELAAQVARKFGDSLRLLRIVDAALRRRWWTRIQLFYLERLRPDSRSNYWFWAEANRRAALPSAIIYLLWLETPEKPADYASATETALLRLLHPEDILFVREGNSSPDFPVSVGDN